MNEPFVLLSSIAAPLPWSDVSTDDIYPGPQASPILRLPGNGIVSRDRARMGENAFAAHRFFDDGTPRPEFVLNCPPYDQAHILIAGPNFGCGSSRESAVWALVGMGIRCLIASSFGAIFYGNCGKNGVLAAIVDQLDAARLAEIAREHPEPVFSVDLRERAISAPDNTRCSFSIGSYQRQLLLDGRDEITTTLERLPQIEGYEADHLAQRPWLRSEE
jgi:3-isopropylmalate/(R)-2-methylmalate dehydratase small subunit